MIDVGFPHEAQTTTFTGPVVSIIRTRSKDDTRRCRHAVLIPGLDSTGIGTKMLRPRRRKSRRSIAAPGEDPVQLDQCVPERREVFVDVDVSL